MKLDTNNYCSIEKVFQRTGRCYKCEHCYITMESEYCIHLRNNAKSSIDFYVEDLNEEVKGAEIVNVIPLTRRAKKMLSTNDDIIDKVWVMDYVEFQNLLSKSNENLTFEKI